MTEPDTRSLTAADQKLLALAARLVPAAERPDWLRSWAAELWCSRHRRAHAARQTQALSALTPGLLGDALWLRAESWRLALRGTPLLCLLGLVALAVGSTALGAMLLGGLEPFCRALARQAPAALIAAPLVLLVATTLAPAVPVAGESRQQKLLHWIRLELFLEVKIALLLLLAETLSVDLCFPLPRLLPLFADYLQLFVFVPLGLLALRWAFLDQRARCTRCLHLLAAPERAGRPSHNLLEWSGTERLCPLGHGLLSVPELETSWRDSSEWIARSE